MVLKRQSFSMSATLAALLFIPSIGIRAGEKVEIKSSTTIELPRPREFNYKPDSKEIERPSVNSGVSLPAPAANPALLNKELKKLLDKKDNWIFMRPEEILMDDKTAAFFKDKEKDNPLLNFQMFKQEKNAQEKYFESQGKRGNNAEKDPREDMKLRMEMNRREAEKEKDPNTIVFGQSSGRNNEFTGIPMHEEGPFGKSQFGNTKSPDFMNRSFGTGLDSAKTPNIFEKEEIKKRTEQRDADFMKMISPRSSLPVAGIPGLPGGLDPLNTQVDTTRMEVNPIRPNRQQMVTFGSEPSKFGNDAAGSFRPELPNSSYSDLLPKAPSVGIFSPSASSPSPAQGISPTSRPFVFEMPRRAF
jgi:hypothetical protein